MKPQKLSTFQAFLTVKQANNSLALFSVLFYCFHVNNSDNLMSSPSEEQFDAPKAAISFKKFINFFYSFIFFIIFFFINLSK